MRSARWAAAAAVVFLNGTLLVRWARKPTVRMRPGETLLYYGGERENAAAVIEGPGGRRLVVFGRVLADEFGAQRDAVVAAQLPLLLQPRARTALILGWAGGDAAASALSHPLRSLQVVESSPWVVKASQLLPRRPGRPLDDRRMRLTISDYYDFLRRPGPRYDVIVCNMEADEDLIRLAKDRLSPDGLLALRVFLEPLDGRKALRPTLQAALRHFGAVSVWSLQGVDGVLLASRRAPSRVSGLDAEFRLAAPAAWLRHLGLSYPATLLSLEAADERTARALAWPRDGRAPLTAFDDRASPEGRSRLLLARYLKERRRPLQPREYLEILLHPRSPKEMPVFYSLLQEWVDRYPRDPRALAFLCVVEEQSGHPDRAAALRARLAALKRRRAGPAVGREIVVPSTGK
jgi:spermidine synthase